MEFKRLRCSKVDEEMEDYLPFGSIYFDDQGQPCQLLVRDINLEDELEELLEDETGTTNMAKIQAMFKTFITFMLKSARMLKENLPTITAADVEMPDFDISGLPDGAYVDASSLANITVKTFPGGGKWLDFQEWYRVFAAVPISLFQTVAAGLDTAGLGTAASSLGTAGLGSASSLATTSSLSAARIAEFSLTWIRTEGITFLQLPDFLTVAGFQCFQEDAVFEGIFIRKDGVWRSLPDGKVFEKTPTGQEWPAMPNEHGIWLYIKGRCYELREINKDGYVFYVPVDRVERSVAEKIAALADKKKIKGLPSFSISSLSFYAPKVVLTIVVAPILAAVAIVATLSAAALAPFVVLLQQMYLIVDCYLILANAKDPQFTYRDVYMLHFKQTCKDYGVVLDNISMDTKYQVRELFQSVLGDEVNLEAIFPSLF
jgi:hypothetical protein